MSERKKILMFTNSEYGQSNVVIATAYELMLSGCEVHIASFETTGHSVGGSAIPKRVAEINAGQYDKISKRCIPAKFHAIAGASMTGALLRKYDDENIFHHGTGVSEALRMYPMLSKIISVWEGPEYIDGFKSCVKIIQEIEPDLIVIERLCAQAMDACTFLSRNSVMISPVTFKETISTIQPYLFGLWGIPADISGFPFPVPWYLIPLNIYLFIRLIISVIFSPSIKALTKIRKEHGLTTIFPFLDPYNKTQHYILPTAPEIDFHFSYIPSNVTACGPILLPSPVLSITDPELEHWLKRRPTILVNFGSNFTANESFTTNLASALMITLLRNNGVQVLWKLKTQTAKDQDDDTATKILQAEVEAGRVRIVSWLKADPSAILRSGSIVCSVHHGGANSYFEAVDAGVPQIILPCWFDTFDFAQRVEFLGIGIYGSRSAAPGVDTEELSKALIIVTDPSSESAQQMARKAKVLREVVARYGGRKAACEKLLELADHPNFRN